MDDQVQHEDANNLEVAGNQELGVNQEPTENQELEENQNPPLIGAAHSGINQADPPANNVNVHSTTGNQVPPMIPQPMIPSMIPQPPGTPATDMGAFMLMMQQQMYQQQQQMYQQQQQLETIMQQNSKIQELEVQLSKANEAKAVDLKQNTEKVRRPVIRAGLSDGDWSYILDAWTRYRGISNLVSASQERICMELRAACEPALDKLLFDLYGDLLKNVDEKQLLEYIKKAAVVSIHKEVHRQTFFRMVQGENESVNTFIAKLKAQAALCDFTVNSSCSKANCAHQQSVSFSEAMICHQMVSGLNDQDNQAQLLSEAEKLDTLEKKFERLLAMEAVSQCTPQLGPDMSNQSKIAAQRSGYKRQGKKKPASPSHQQSTPKDNWKCPGCGKTSHPGKTNAREDCPAWGKQCSSCNKKNHFASVCRNISKAALAEESTDDAGLPSKSMAGKSVDENQVFRKSLTDQNFM